jgi:hypothetical protein
MKRQQNQAKKRGFYTPAPVQARVITRHMSGQSNRRIAREERIDPETVGRILSQQEVAQRIAQYQTRLFNLVPTAISVYEDALNSDDLPLATATATKLLEGTHVLSKGGIEETLNIASKASPEAEREQKKLLVYGQMIDMVIQKNKNFDLGLPPEIKNMAQEAERRIDEPSDRLARG